MSAMTANTLPAHSAPLSASLADRTDVAAPETLPEDFPPHVHLTDCSAAPANTRTDGRTQPRQLIDPAQRAAMTEKFLGFRAACDNHRFTILPKVIPIA